MVQRCFIIIYFLLFVSAAKAQFISLSGNVIDERKEGAVGVSVILLHPKDSSLVQGAVTDVNGNFIINDAKTNTPYVVKLMSMGYKTIFKNIFTYTEPIQLGTFNLVQESKLFKEVTVEAKQTLATQQGDTTSYNANAFKVNKDATAEDLVNKMPGVTVVDGKVNAQGEEVKQVTVDGKQFFGDDANAVLKNLPAEIIDKVQVFDKRSDQSLFTGFDDGSAQKTINIVTKPQFRNGLFGKAYAGYGYDNKYKVGGVINYFKDKRRLTVLAQMNNINEQNFSSDDLAGVMSSGSNGGKGSGRGQRGVGGQGNGGQNPSDNFLVNTTNGINTTSAIGINYLDKWGKKTDITGSYFFNFTNNNALSNLYQQYIIGNTNGLIYNENNTVISDNYNNRINFKFDTKLDSNNQITIQPKASFQNNTNSKKLFGDNIKLDTTISNTENKTSSTNFSYNISLPILYRHSFPKKGRTLSINITPTITKNNGDGNLYILNNYYNTTTLSDTINQTTITGKNGKTISGNITYTEPLSLTSFLLVSYNTTYNSNYSSKKNYDYNYTSNNYTLLDTSLSNVFGNSYQSQSGGIGYKYQKPKLNITLNAAYQWAQLSKNQEYPSSLINSRIFQSILPTAQLQYKITPKKNLRLTYKTSNNAPSIEQLQDVVNNTNSLQLSTGNSDLKQDFQQALNIRYSAVNTEKATSFFALVNGNYSSNYISNSTLIANNDTTVYNSIYLAKGSQITRPVNVNNYYTIRSFINYTFPISIIKSNLSVNASGNYNNIPGLINQNLNYAKTATAGLGLVLSSNISQKFDYSISSNSSYSNINNTLQSSANTTYFSQNSKLKINLNPWKGLILQTEYINSYYNGLSSSYNQTISLWNAAIGYKFLKNKQAELKLMAYDILNQNNSIQRTNTDSYIQDIRTNALNRYLLLLFTYNFKKYFEVK